jgi:hypothetical protein
MDTSMHILYSMCHFPCWILAEQLEYIMEVATHALSCHANQNLFLNSMHKNMDSKFSSLHENMTLFHFCYSDLEPVAV